jgi:large subunit ribosomal protein L30
MPKDHVEKVDKPAKAAHHKKPGTIRIKWVVSFIGSTDDMRATIRGLGFRKMHRVVEREDNESIRGMIHKVRHLVEVVE